MIIGIYCKCEDWGKSSPEILEIQLMAAVMDSKYTGKPFGFCPWCGDRVFTRKENGNESN